MLYRRALLPLCAVFLVSVASAAPDTKSDNRCPPGPGMHGGMMGMVAPEARIMMMADAEKATADGSLSMEDYRAMQREKMKAMTPEQRDAFFANLVKRFKALPADEQAKLKAEEEKRRKDHPMGMMGGRPPGDHPPGDRPNCPPPPPKN